MPLSLAASSDSTIRHRARVDIPPTVVSTIIKSATVVIVGAGAAGLQTAHTLVTEYGYAATEILLLEARQRVGGRIHTWHSRSPSDGNNNNVVETPAQQRQQFPPLVDLGAAWVHGTQPIPCPNPMLDYLPTSLLQEIAPGNPWMRPWTVLHRGQRGAFLRSQNRGNDERHATTVTKSPQLHQPLIQLFHNGHRLDTDGVEKDSESTNDSLVCQALSRHFDLLQNKLPRYAQALYRQGRGLETALVSVADALQAIRSSHDDDDDGITSDCSRDNRLLLDALADFYLYLVSAWYGKSLSQLQLSNFATLAPSRIEETGEGSHAVSGGVTPKPTPATQLQPPDWIYQEEGDFGGPHCIVPGGMEQLLQPLLDVVDDSRVHLGQQVHSIQWQPLRRHCDDIATPTVAGHNNHKTALSGEIHVHCVSGEMYTAQACVVTLPVNCLRARTMASLFSPPMSGAKQEALQYISMGSYKKVMCTFDRIFWPTNPPFLGLTRACNTTAEDVTAEDGLGNALLLDNLWAKDGYPCWEAILVGDAADWATHKSDNEICTAVLDFVQQAMGMGKVTTDDESISQWCTGCHVTRWEEDPYSLGAYASLSLGALPRHVDALRAPEWNGALMLAGDAIVDEDFEGSVHAALLSGKSAAQQIHEYLSTLRK